MHTIKEDNDGYAVGYLRGTQGDEFVPMFTGLEMTTALRLTSMLNGGGYVETGCSPSTLESCWRAAHRGGK